MKTIQDIAELANVSKSTVSRYLNGGSVSKAIQVKLARIIEETGYRPNKFAQSLRAKKTGLIGAIVPRLTSQSAALTLSGLDSYLRDNDYQLLIVNTDQSMEREIESIYTVAKQKVDGIVLFATTVTENHLEAIESIGIPVVLIGQQHPDVHSLVYDDYQAGRELARHVASLGYRDAVYMGVSKADEAIGVLRRNGVEDGLTVEGVLFSFKESAFQIEAAVQSAFEILDTQLPEIILCATDELAFGVLKAARSKGISVPSQLGVTGFGGYSMTSAVSPVLTTIQFHFRQSGIEAGRVIFALIDGEEQPKKTLLTYELVIQESAVKRN